MAEKMRISFKQTCDILFPYIKSRIVTQVKAVSLIIVYLLLFQILVLGLPVSQASVIAVGLGLVIFGLALFMEGLLLGLMPLGESLGFRLPQKTSLPFLLIFALLLGFGATLAEPAVGILKAAGNSVMAWNAPLLFLLLNKYSHLLVYAVGGGVGIAVLFGMLRFIYGWSLKPFIYALVGTLLSLTVWGFFQPNLLHLTGVAWDCGGITTGPVTVPLVLALGIGISRVAGKGKSGASSGFGVVTLASAFPIIMVLLLGIFFMNKVPSPAPAGDFFSAPNRTAALSLFRDRTEMEGYAFRNADEAAQKNLFDGDEIALLNRLIEASRDRDLRIRMFGSEAAFFSWLDKKATIIQRMAVFEANPELQNRDAVRTTAFNPTEVVRRNSFSAVQAILPLSLFLLLIFFVIVREKLPRADEISLGLFLAILGMSLFNIGIELGLAKIGNQVGSRLPSSFKAIEITEDKTVISHFDLSLVQKSVSFDGQTSEFFFVKDKNTYKALPFQESNYDSFMKKYIYTPLIGPLFGREEKSFAGILVVLLFAFFLGYGATLAEPALNALGLTVEELSVGTFKKSLLVQAVAIGVGIGIAWGLAKIIWNLPLVWLLAPPYIICLVLTLFSTEDFVNIGWDSAGVTTGPITVPLVLAMGLGISGEVGVTEGFGILSLASVWPIMSVLIVGMFVTMKRKKALVESASES